MKHSFLVSLVVVLATFLTSEIAFAKDNQSKIVVVDIEKVISDSEVSKSIQKQMEKQRESYQKNIDSRDEELRLQKEKIEGERANLSPEAFEKKEREFYTNVAEAQRSVQLRRNELGRAYDEAMNKVYRKTREIIETMAKEKGFIVALPSSQILYNDMALDISEDVHKSLDSNLKFLQVNFDQGEAESEKKAEKPKTSDPKPAAKKGEK